MITESEIERMWNESKVIIATAKNINKMSLHSIEASPVAIQYQLLTFIMTGEEKSIGEYYNSI